MEAMTRSVSTGRTATLGPPAAASSLEADPLDTATDGATAAVAAIELMRKWRLFIGDFHLGFPARHQYTSAPTLAPLQTPSPPSLPPVDSTAAGGRYSRLRHPPREL